MKKGLTNEEVIKNRELYGSNKLNEFKKESIISLFLESLGDPIIKILIIALAIKIVLFLDNFDWYETIGIVIAIFIASLISTISEYGSEKAFEKIVKEASKLKCHVLRDKKIEILIDEVVKDDLVYLDVGDKIPADGILIDGSVAIDESAINGEAFEKWKDKGSTIYRGTIVVSGTGLMRVEAVGFNTMYGKLASELKTKKSETPLKLRLTVLANQLSKVGYFLAILVALAYLFSVFIIKNNFNLQLFFSDITNFPYLIGHLLYSLTLAVTVIIVAVPEGLPMMITLVLSSNMKKMVKNNVLVRKMNGIETAGNINLLFTDKTGTITTGKFSVNKVITGSLMEYSDYAQIKEKDHFNKLFIKSLGNNNKCEFNGEVIGGNLTDQALFKFIDCQKLKLDVTATKEFDSKNKYSSIFANQELIIKGAPEIILEKCSKYFDEFGYSRPLINKIKLLSKIDALTGIGNRVIACAIGENSKSINDVNNLTFVCLISIHDDIKENMADVIKKLNKASINTVMITGDNKNTALTIGQKIGLVTDKYSVITSDDLNKMSDEELYDKITDIKIVARALPSDKSRLVKMAKKRGFVVGMTGDGINDAPALKLADVGFAMGSGVEIAKEAADIVILDNNLSSIATSVLYGRTTFKNIRKFIMFQLTINICAIALSVIGPFVGVQTPVTVMQMLWINMIMDTLAGLAFSFEQPRPDYMEEKPLEKECKIISNYMKNQITLSSIYITSVLFLFLKLPFIKNIFDNNDTLMTGFFALFIFISIFNAFNIRTHRLNIFADLLKNKCFIGIIIFIIVVQLIIIYFGGTLFRTVAINPKQLLFVIFISLSIIPVDLIRKLFLKVRNKNIGV